MKSVALCLLFIIIISLAFCAHSTFWRRTDKNILDVYYLWSEGNSILNGENPYERTLSGNMRVNKKYATHFPLFYLLGSLTQKCGLQNYESWISFWQVIFLLFNVGIAYVIFHVAHFQYRWTAFAVFASLFWLFNRWTLDVSYIFQTDFIAIFFLVLSLSLFYKHKQISLLLFSLSLAVKGIAIFLTPLYLIWVWQTSDKAPLKKTFLAAITIMSVPIIASLPFILWNAEAFMKSLLFNVTRNAMAHFPGPSIDMIFRLSGITARIPMFLLLLLVYISAFKKKMGIYTGTLLATFVFLSFNPVLFRHYICWIIPFVPLAACERLNCYQS